MQKLVDAVAAATGVSKEATGKAIDAVIAAITGEVTKGETVHLAGFGSFSAGARCAGRPQSGDRRPRPDACRWPDCCQWRRSQQGSRDRCWRDHPRGMIGQGLDLSKPAW